MYSTVVLLAISGAWLSQVSVSAQVPPAAFPTTTSLLERTTSTNEQWRVREGDFCNANSYPIPGVEERSQYYSCKIPTDDEIAWPWTEVGIWVKMTCDQRMIFSHVNKSCVERETKKRRFPLAGGGGLCGSGQGVLCQPPAPPVIPVPCPHATGGGATACPGCPCSWMLAPLAIDPNTPHGYLQCAPAFPGIYCGVWTPMPCAPATRFDVVVQVCVHDECASPPCGGGYAAGFSGGGYAASFSGGGYAAGSSGGCGTGLVSLGPCSGGGCPGSATCTANVCCGGGGGYGK